MSAAPERGRGPLRHIVSHIFFTRQCKLFGKKDARKEIFLIKLNNSAYWESEWRATCGFWDEMQKSKLLHTYVVKSFNQIRDFI